MLMILKNIFFMFACLLPATYSNSCNFDVKVEQTLRGEGFHRNLTYGIVFNEDEAGDLWQLEDCMVGLDQILPPGVYANPDELRDLRRQQRLSLIPKNRVNTELPAEQAGPSGVYVIGELVHGKAHLWLPVHARYHRAGAGIGLARNELYPPRLFVRCAGARLAACAGATANFLCTGFARDLCVWLRVPYTMVAHAPIWDVPVGNTDHYNVVAGCTTLVVVVGSLYLLKGIHEYKVTVRRL